MPLQATSGAASYDAFGGGVAAVPNYIEDVFSTYLYTGNGGTQTITNSIDLSTKGGLVWIKQRNSTAISGGLPSQHLLFDTNRGANNMLASNSTYQSLPLNGYSFNNTGFTVAQYTNTDGTYPYEGNQSSVPYASWTFREQPKFFDVVTYTGNGTSPRTISHNLGSAPGFIAVKPTSQSGSWWCYHRSLGAGKTVSLNATDAALTSNNFWGGVAPTSTDFTVQFNNNESGVTYVAYLFAHDAGGFGLTGTDNVISCGSFNPALGFVDINLGYEPQWILFKRTDNTGNWRCYDTMRGWTADINSSTGANAQELSANLSDAEVARTDTVSVSTTGFRVKGLGSSGTYIYIAIRRGPMKVPTDGTSVFSPVTYTGDGTTARDFTNFGMLPDFVMLKQRNGTEPNHVIDRLRGGGNYLVSSATQAESAYPVLSFDSMNGVNDLDSYFNASGATWVFEAFRRAPSFFDEVCETSTSATNKPVTHNLAAVPEFIIVKKRSASGTNWVVYASAVTTLSQYLVLNTTAAKATSSNIWGLSAPTSTTFNINENSVVGSTGSTYVAYLFATCAGVSKVGSYTGTGTTKQVDCGFTSGARFVLIKRTDSTGDWYVWDSARGIVSGNDPYLLLNSTDAEVTSTDYIDTYSAGFEISSTAPAAINVSGGTYIFLAIA